VRSGDFREDLFYRLNVVPIWLPPLRTRREDIEVLARRFCTVFAQANGKGDVAFSEDALRVLRRERWPGNVRQLQNLVERLVLLADGAIIEAEAVRQELANRPSFVTEPTSTALTRESIAAVRSGSLEQERREAERRALIDALERAAGNRTLAARELGVSRRTLYNKLEEYDLIDR
jgi:two-component system response regulator AtoC